jgi:phage terminase Nu1 subunit (DNA packaging protein)
LKSITHLDELKSIEVSTKVFANLVGLSTRRIQQLRELGLPFNGRGRIHLVEGYQWLLQYQKPETENLSEAKLRKLTAEANLRELEVGEAEGRLLERDAIISAVQSSLLKVKTRLLAIPTKLGHALANELNAASAKNILETEISAALSELSLMYQPPKGKKR